MNVRKISKTHYVILFAFLSFVSCKDESKNVEPQNKITIDINLPLSISVGEYVEGAILYKSDFDTINLDENERRYLTVYLTKSKIPIRSVDQLKKMKLDTFVSISNNVIPIFDLKFSKKGRVFIEGYIVDEVYLNHMEEDAVRLITLETKFSRAISVE